MALRRWRGRGDSDGKENDGKRETDDGSESGTGKRYHGTGETGKGKRADGCREKKSKVSRRCR